MHDEEEQQERLIDGSANQTDNWDAALRPKKLDEYVGQEKIRANLSVYIQAARARHESLDHVLL